jgi:phosphoglycolate phosphatase-like HAD superfamily hydrolase
MVGDYLFDLEAGKNAGVATVHLDVDGEFLWPEYSDYTVTSLKPLADLFRH